MFKLSTCILILVLFSNTTSAIDISAGVSFETDNAEYYIDDAFSCDGITVYNNAFKINNGNISVTNSTLIIKIFLEDLNDGNNQIYFVSNITIDTLTISNNFASFSINDNYLYSLSYQSGSTFFKATSSGGVIEYNNIPSDSWVITSVYHHYSKNFDKLFDIGDPWSMLSTIFGTYESVCGATLFWLIIIIIPFMMTWIKTQSVIIPSILALITGSTLFVLLPVEAIGTIKILMMIGIAGLLYHIIKSR